MEYVTRINLKTSCGDRREDLIKYCLQGNQQYIVIGWSYIYGQSTLIHDYDSFYRAVRDDVKRINPAFNIFRDVSEGDLFWTRDKNGYYWVCRVQGKAEPHCDVDLDIGARIPVRAFCVGLEVPGQIKASFNRARGGITERISDEQIIEYSKFIYNKHAGQEIYNWQNPGEGFLNNLPEFELEELVISYLQIKENYYLLSNSIAKKSTTVKIECELISRDIYNPKKAVVQVKGKKAKEIDAISYKAYDDCGIEVYFYAPVVVNLDCLKYGRRITEQEILEFYNKYKPILPDSIVRWEDIFT